MGAREGRAVVEAVVARLEWVLVDPTEPHTPADFVPPTDVEVLVAAGSVAAAVAAVAFHAVRLLRSEHGPPDFMLAGTEAALIDATPGSGIVERRAGDLFGLACRGENQTMLRLQAEQALHRLPPGEALPLLAAVLELFVAHARRLRHPGPC